MLANFCFLVNGTFHKIALFSESSQRHFVEICTKIWL